VWGLTQSVLTFAGLPRPCRPPEQKLNTRPHPWARQPRLVRPVGISARPDNPTSRRGPLPPLLAAGASRCPQRTLALPRAEIPAVAPVPSSTADSPAGRSGRKRVSGKAGLKRRLGQEGGQQGRRLARRLSLPTPPCMQ
jgi:hypothetical protein